MSAKRKAELQMYWRDNIRVVSFLLLIWFAVAYGCSIFCIELLNQVQIGNVGLGFWFAQQGAIYGFILLTFIYALAMARLEKRLGLEEPDA